MFVIIIIILFFALSFLSTKASRCAGSRLTAGQSNSQSFGHWVQNQHFAQKCKCWKAQSNTGDLEPVMCENESELGGWLQLSLLCLFCTTSFATWMCVYVCVCKQLNFDRNFNSRKWGKTLRPCIHNFFHSN